MKDTYLGKTFNKLTVLYTTPKLIKGKKYYHCKCECGSKKYILGYHLNNGHTKSCGCFRIENTSKQNKIKRCVDLTNLKFGKLLVLKNIGQDNLKRYCWLCKCDCGKEKIIAGPSLVSGHTKSCGCYKLEIIQDKVKQYRVSKGKDPEKSLSLEYKIQRSKFKDSKIRKQVLLRDNYECQFCPNIHENLEIHHILSWSKYPKLRYELTNLITLCKICHIPIIHNGNIKIKPHEQTTLMLQDIIKRKTNVN